MAIPSAATAKFHPLLLAAVVVTAVLLVVLVLLAVQQGTATGEIPEAAGTVLAETAQRAPPDADRDGLPDKTTDLDDDNDGWSDVDDPRPLSLNNLDNDAQRDDVDTDDDNDGKPDPSDRYPKDQNNNGEADAAERRRLGPRFDGDRDGRPDLAELRRVALAEADKLGVDIKHTVRSLADIPREVFRQLPDGWNFVCQDRDNDGNHDITDRFDFSPGGSYAAYTHDGAWEQNYARHAPDGQSHGLIAQGYDAAVGQEPPRHEIPQGWPPPGYVPGGGLTTGESAATSETGGTTSSSGGHTYDYYHDYYGHTPPPPTTTTEAASPPTDGGGGTTDGGGGTAPAPPPSGGGHEGGSGGTH